MPGASRWPSSSNGWRTTRPANAITGRERCTSRIVASRSALPPACASSTRRSRICGWRRRRSTAQLSVLAVVSWPATSIVTSSSRISASLIGVPSSCRAWTISARTSTRSASAGSARAAAISSSRIASIRARNARNLPHGEHAPEVVAQPGRERDLVAERGPRWQQLFESPHPLAFGAEHRPQNRAQRDPLHRPRRRELDVLGPAVDLLGGDLGDHRLVAPHPLALERRQQQLALLHVLALVDPQQRVGPEQFAQRASGSGVQHRRIGPEDLLDQRRIGHDHRRAEADHPDREQ